MPRRVILDTDTGVDDALAILLALRSPEFELDLCLQIPPPFLDLFKVAK